jgi:hypothetical protein
MEFPFNTEKSTENSHLRPPDFASASTRRKSPLEPLKIAGKTRLQAVGFNGSRVASHGFSSLSGFSGLTGHGFKLLGSAGAPQSPDSGSGCRSWRIGPPWAHGLTGSFPGFLSLGSRALFLSYGPSVSLSPSSHLSFYQTRSLSISRSLYLYTLTLSVRVLGGRKKK